MVEFSVASMSDTLNAELTICWSGGREEEGNEEEEEEEANLDLDAARLCAARIACSSRTPAVSGAKSWDFHATSSLIRRLS